MPTSKIGLHDLDPSLFETLSNISGSNSQTKIFPLQVVASEDNQTIFPIGLDTFDAEKDFAFVQSGVTNLFYGADFTIENKNIILNEGVPVGRTLGIYVLKNVAQSDEEDYVSGANLAPDSVTPDKIGGVLPIEKGGTGAITAEDARANLGINSGEYLPLTGGTLTGDLQIKSSSSAPEVILRHEGAGRYANLFEGSDGNTYLRNSLDDNNRTALYLQPENIEDFGRVLRLQKKLNGTTNYYNIFGEHNLDLLASQIQNILQGGNVSMIKSVQRGVISMADGQSSQTATINSVNVNKAMVSFLGTTYTGASSNHTARLKLTDNTTVTATRSTSGSSTAVSYEVIEFY